MLTFGEMWRFLGALHIFLVDTVLADYCEFGLCDEKEYCCGKNICCDTTVDPRLFWGGVLLVIFVLAVIAICRKIRRGQNPGYHIVNDRPYDEEDS